METKPKTADHAERLQEIAKTQLGSLSDDSVLDLLAERKRLFEEQREYEKAQKEDTERLALEKKQQEEREYAMRVLQKQKEELENKLANLNRSITPDKGDDELLVLIARRKELEKQLGEFGQVTPRTGGGQEIGKEPPSQTSHLDLSLRKEFGEEGIAADDFQEGSAFATYLHQLKNNTGSLGALLQEMPADAKKNKAFMLKVAEIDPAYAMHYADTDTLKKDEDFNVRVASLRNPRNSGNALSEMLPEARTSKVVLAAVKRDYRNVRFIQPNMDDYDEMMRIAKKAALEKVRDLKEAADIALLIPRPLQQDKEFMTEVKESIIYGTEAKENRVREKEKEKTEVLS